MNSDAGFSTTLRNGGGGGKGRWFTLQCTRDTFPPHVQDRNWRKCRCPKWLYWANKGQRYRISAKTDFWATAEEEARRREQELRNIELGKPVPEEKGKTVAEAVAFYLDNKRSEHLKDSTLTKLRLIFEKQMLDWCGHNGIHFLTRFTLPKLQEWRKTWKDGALAASKKQQRVRGFFYFCHNNGWILSNPAKGLSRIQVPRNEPDYFRPSELKQILDAIPKYGKTDADRLRIGHSYC
jgi:integrase